MATNRYIKQLSKGQTPTQVHQLFTTIENGLKIDNSEYKNIRRTIINRKSGNITALRHSATKLVYAARALLKSSDLTHSLEELVIKKKLTSRQIIDNEPALSKDTKFSGNTDLYYIAELVGYSNVFMAIKFLELMEKGETIPTSVQKGFKPAIELLVDIIRGGPSYMTALKTLRKQAKRDSKKNA